MLADRLELAEQVRVGTRVALELVDDAGNREPMTFDIVREQFADFAKGLLGIQTPLAKAILRKRAGTTVAYQMGDICQVAITHVTLSPPIELDNTESRRQAALQKALEAAERTTAEMFAASYSGKWGDYQLGEHVAMPPSENSENRNQSDD